MVQVPGIPEIAVEAMELRHMLLFYEAIPILHYPSKMHLILLLCHWQQAVSPKSRHQFCCIKMLVCSCANLDISSNAEVQVVAFS